MVAPVIYLRRGLARPIAPGIFVIEWIFFGAFRARVPSISDTDSPDLRPDDLRILRSLYLHVLAAKTRRIIFGDWSG